MEPKFKEKQLVKVAYPDLNFKSEGFKQWYNQIGFIERLADLSQSKPVYSVRFLILEPLTADAMQYDGTWNFYENELEAVTDED